MLSGCEYTQAWVPILGGLDCGKCGWEGIDVGIEVWFGFVWYYSEAETSNIDGSARAMPCEQCMSQRRKIVD
jgi:hypothetical protein